MSELTSIAIDPVEAVPAGTPALQRAVAQEDCVRIGRATNGQTVKKPGEWVPRGYQAVLRLHTQNVLKEPCQVHLVSSTGEVLMTCELPGLSTTHAVVAVQLSGTTYASCTTSVTQGGAALGVTTSVTRADGSGGTVVAPLDQGCGSAKCNLLILGFMLWVCLIGIFFICAAWAMPVTGAVTSLDGAASYAPHSESRGTKTLNFVPDPKDKKKDSYRAFVRRQDQVGRAHWPHDQRGQRHARNSRGGGSSGFRVALGTVTTQCWLV